VPGEPCLLKKGEKREDGSRDVAYACRTSQSVFVHWVGERAAGSVHPASARTKGGWTAAHPPQKSHSPVSSVYLVLFLTSVLHLLLIHMLIKPF